MPNLLNELTHYVRPRVAIRAVPTATVVVGDQAVGQVDQVLVGYGVPVAEVVAHVGGDAGDPGAAGGGGAQPVGLPGDAVPVGRVVQPGGGPRDEHQVADRRVGQVRREPEERHVEGEQQRRVGVREDVGGQHPGGVGDEVPEAVQVAEPEIGR